MSTIDGMTIFCKRGFVVFTNTGEQKQDDKKNRKHNKNRSVVYPHFEDMKEFNDNSYWNDQLTKFSRGIFPRNFKYYNEVLHYKTKKNIKIGKQEYSVDSDDLEKSFQELKLFLEDKGILSTLERVEKSLIDFKEEDDDMNSWRWQDFKSNQILLQEEYINRLSEEYDLDEKGKAKLESIISFGVSSGIFGNNSIFISEAKIEKIEGLLWDDEEEKFYISSKITLPKFQPSSKKSSNSKSSRYSSHTFSGDTFCIRNKETTIKVGDKWKNFLSDYYK